MSEKKIFLDMQFTGLHKLTTAISIGLVAADGKKFYAEFTDYDKTQVDDFISGNVLSNLFLTDYDFEKDYDPDTETVMVKGDIELIKITLTEWLKMYEETGVEIWGDTLSYDWVLFVSIFGNAFDVPDFVNYIPMDIATALKNFGVNKDINRAVFVYGDEIPSEVLSKRYNALFQAEMILEVYKKLLNKVSNELDSSAGSAAIDEDGIVDMEEIKDTDTIDFVEPTVSQVNSSKEWKSPLH